MSDEHSAPPPPASPPPADPPPPGTPPGPPPASPPPPSQPGGGGGSAGGPVSENRTVMIVLSYLGILALIPFLIEKRDREVQWHAKHGLVWTAVWIILGLVLSIVTTVLGNFVPGLGCLTGCAVPLVLTVAILVLHVMMMVKGVNGERFTVPGISEWADKF